MTKPTTKEIISLIIFFLFLFAIYATEAVLLIAFALGKLQISIFLSVPALLIHALAVTGVICFLYGYYIEPYRLEINRLTLTTDKLKKTTFRLIHISDLHCERKERLENTIVPLINDTGPDIIVFTGDCINSAGALPRFKEIMSGLKADLAKLAVEGNHDVKYWKGTDFYSGTGFELLDNKTVTIEKNGEKIYISGLSWNHTDPLRQLLKNVPDDGFSILLYHFPDLIEDLQGRNVDLYLCGHTHAGQVALPLYGAVVTLTKFNKKYESGKYTVGSTTMYVNSGIGLDRFPAPKVRFLTRPEIAIFDIQPRG